MMFDCKTKKLLGRSAVFAEDLKATVMLETTFIVPVLLIIGLGVFEFGNFFYQRHLVDAGVRDAARYVASFPINSNAGADIADAKEIALTGQIGGGTYRVSWWNDPNTINISYSQVAATFSYNSNTISLRNSSGGQVDKVVVSATVPYQSLGFLTGPLGLSNITFTVSHEERWIGNR